MGGIWEKEREEEVIKEGGSLSSWIAQKLEFINWLYIGSHESGSLMECQVIFKSKFLLTIQYDMLLYSFVYVISYKFPGGD